MSGELVIPAEELQAPDGYSWRWHCTQKDAEIERLGKELESADRVANDWARQNVELRAENERLRGLLRPFAALPVNDLGQCQRHPDEPVFAINGVSFTATDVLRAGEALGEDIPR